MSTLTAKLREGSIYAPKRWSGDTGNYSLIDEKATDELLVQAADEIDKLERENAQLQAELAAARRLLADAESTIQSLSDQQAIPDYFYQPVLAKLRAAIDEVKKGTQ